MPRVLVVDDSLSVRKVVERALASKRIEVITAASGGEALEQIGRETPDLVVCDVIMPDMDGYQICEHIKTHPRLSGTPVLLISGIVNSTVLERAARVRSDDVLRKPFASEELLSRIESLLAARAKAAAPPPLAPAPAVEAAAVAPTPAAEEGLREPRAEVSPTDVKGELGKLAALPGVALAVLVDRDGCLIGTAGDLPVEPEAAGALASFFVENTSGLGRDLGQGILNSVMIEYDTGVVLLSGVGASALLALVVRDVAASAKVRYHVKSALPGLLKAL